MPAVENRSTVDQCDKLNKTSFPNLWFDNATPDATAIPLIVAGGALNSFTSAISLLSPVELDANILLNPSMTSTYSLEKFLSGGGVANASGDFKKLGNVLLSVGVAQGTSGRTYQSIVDNYFVEKLGSTPYTYSTTSSPKLTASMLWAPSDSAALINGTTTTSVIGNLIKNRLLLSEREVYNPSDFDPNLAIPPANTESLMYLQSIANYSSGASSTTDGGTTRTTITQGQETRRTTLEARNLRFFGAWLAEYCYYRSRYNWLVKKYFQIYTTQPYAAPNITTNSTLAKFFAGPGSGPNQYTEATKGALPQSEYLRCLVYHLACLNTRMVDMRFLLGKISEYYSDVQTTIQNAVNSNTTLGSNKDLTDKIAILNESAANVQKYITERDFRQGVMDYNSEKNRYANILLGLYAFLNILAVAVIVQIKQS
jgi:hypothetical protein